MAIPIRVHRAFADISQRALGSRAGISQTVIHEIERGYRTPDIKQKTRIAKALKVQIEDIEWVDKA